MQSRQSREITLDNKEYVKLALVTESPVDEALVARASSKQVIRLLHGAMGLVTEAAEIIDQLKKHIFYGKPLDLVNINEEQGDAEWYQAILCDETGAGLDAIHATNIAKLEKRYGSKFDAHRAMNRDLDAERRILEGTTKA